MRILFLIFLPIIYSLHLTFQQKKLINQILQHPSKTEKQHNTIKKILFYSYEKLAIKQAYDFKKRNRYLCRDISQEELSFCSKFGLWKSIVIFKGTSYLENYCPLYIKHELLKKINSFPMKQKEKIYEIDLSSSDYSKKKYRLKQMKIWNYISTLDILSQKIFAMKFDYSLHKQRSNKEIAEKIGYSEEFVRKRLLQIVKSI